MIRCSFARNTSVIQAVTLYDKESLFLAYHGYHQVDKAPDDSLGRFQTTTTMILESAAAAWVEFTFMKNCDHIAIKLLHNLVTHLWESSGQIAGFSIT